MHSWACKLTSLTHLNDRNEKQSTLQNVFADEWRSHCSGDGQERKTERGGGEVRVSMRGSRHSGFMEWRSAVG